MKVRDIMTREVKFCSPDANLAAATDILWSNDCGAIPVVDASGKLAGMLTDRDICIALGTRDSSARDVAVGDVATQAVVACAPGDDVQKALKTMRQHKVRRLPVAGEEGTLEGLLCLNDVVLHAEKSDGKKTVGISYEDAVATMKAICEHRASEARTPATKAAGAATAS